MKLRKKKEKKRNTITRRKQHLTNKFKYRGFCNLEKTKITMDVYTTYQVNFVKYSIK